MCSMELHLIELHSMKLHLINCCFNIFSFQVPMKNTAYAYTYYEKNNKQYYVHCTRTTSFFHNQLELNYESFYLDVISPHQHFHYILQLIYQLTFFYTYSFYNLNILQDHMINHIQIYNYLDSRQILYDIFLRKTIFYIHICIYLHSIFVYCDKQLHLVYIYTYPTLYILLR